MAKSPTHQFGQIIGNLIELAVRETLLDVAKKYELYLDWKHSRKARNNKKKVTWQDYLGNNHDLDYVLEKGGSESIQGKPKAFIEIAYRRYTKHSRNKSQEIQGAIIPLVNTYRTEHPFIGAILAGEFTEDSITQLKSHGFGIIFFPFFSIVEAFSIVGIDAYFNESTTDQEVATKVNKWELLTEQQQESVITKLRELHENELQQFTNLLETKINRHITQIIVLTIHGLNVSTKSLQEAVNYILQYEETSSVNLFLRYELEIRYSNKDTIKGNFESKQQAINFLNKFL